MQHVLPYRYNMCFCGCVCLCVCMLVCMCGRAFVYVCADVRGFNNCIVHVCLTYKVHSWLVCRLMYIPHSLFRHTLHFWTCKHQSQTYQTRTRLKYFFFADFTSYVMECIQLRFILKSYKKRLKQAIELNMLGFQITFYVIEAVI